MNIHRQWMGRLAALVMIVGLAVPVGRAEGPYHFAKEIAVGGEGGWDYLSVDAAARRLYVAQATRIVVINLDTERVVGEIANTPGVHGLALAPELGLGFSSNGRESKVGIVDLKRLETLSKVEAGENPDAILYDPASREVYAFNGGGRSVTVIGTANGKVVATIPLAGKPEFAVADPPAGRVYCNLEDHNAVAVIDTASHRVVASWPIAPGEEATGLALDAAHHRLFIGCHNRRLLMMDSGTGKVIATVPIGERVDANAFDPATRLVFSSNGDGTVTIAREESPEKLTVIQTLTTEPGARTMALDPQTHQIYLASAKFESPSPAAAAAPRQRRRMVPGSFKILVYAMEMGPGAGH